MYDNDDDDELRYQNLLALILGLTAYVKRLEDTNNNNSKIEEENNHGEKESDSKQR